MKSHGAGHAARRAAAARAPSKLQRLFDARADARCSTARASAGCCWPASSPRCCCRSAWPSVQWVVLKMLPFDNKSEFQVVLEMPAGTPLERHRRRRCRSSAPTWPQQPEVRDLQGYAGTASPITFNGLVRQYYLRADAEQGDLQVNLVDKQHRDEQSHAIAQRLRPALDAIAAQPRRAAQGGRGAARPAGAERRWWPRSTAPTRPAASSWPQRVAKAFGDTARHRRHRQHAGGRRAARLPAHQPPARRDARHPGRQRSRRPCMPRCPAADAA